MKEKGFTLIELLAVIVILAIIALIATPIILGIIKDSKEESNKRSAELYIDAVEQAIVRKNLNGKFKPNLCEINSGVVTCDGKKLEVEVEGIKPSDGWIYITDGVIKQYSLKLEVNTVINKDAEGKVTNGTEVAKKPIIGPICKRADVKTLHTETCTQTSNYCYAAGYVEGNKGITIKYGNEMLGKLKGFKNFLETVEKEKLESLVLQNPNYFYDILPYTYVLGVSDKWIKKFESISLQSPSWYDGSDSFEISTIGTFMNSTMAYANRAMSSSPSSSSGGSSGGGSSGGGSGGGGGGSW